MKNTSAILIEVLLKAIDKIGIRKTIRILEVSQITNDNTKLLQEAIIITTCKSYGISESMLLKGRKNIQSRTNAVGVASVLLYRQCKLSQREIAEVLNKEHTNINKYIKKFESLDENFKLDKEIIEQMETIKQNALDYYESQLNN